MEEEDGGNEWGGKEWEGGWKEDRAGQIVSFPCFFPLTLAIVNAINFAHSWLGGGRLVSVSVCHYFLKSREVSLPTFPSEELFKPFVSPNCLCIYMLSLELELP